MTTYTQEKYKELSASSVDELSYITDIDKVKKLALLLRAELYKCEAQIESLEADRVEYEEGCKLACDALDNLETERDHYIKGCNICNAANESLIQIIRDINVNNLNSYKSQVRELFPDKWADSGSDSG